MDYPSLFLFKSYHFVFHVGIVLMVEFLFELSQKLRRTIYAYQY